MVVEEEVRVLALVAKVVEQVDHILVVVIHMLHSEKMVW